MKRPSLKEIESQLGLVKDKHDPYLLELGQDDRKGVVKLLARTYKRLDKEAQALASHQERLHYEDLIYSHSPQALIAGVDEVGRGPLAGPVVACALILPNDTHQLIGVNDSKSLSPKRRQEFRDLILDQVIAYSIAVVPVEKIDEVNILQATKLAMALAVEKLEPQPDYLLIDALRIESSIPQEAIVKGDQRSLSIAAASIVAKEYRDELMKSYAQDYPEFGWDQNMGYGTQPHLQALAQYGYTPIHRRSFEPVKSMNLKYFQK